MGGRFLVATFGVLIWPSMAHAATLYWVGAPGALTSDAANWMTRNPVTCGPGDAKTAPGPADRIVFAADCDHGATIRADLTVSMLTLQSGYGGTVQQVPGTTVTVGSFQQDDGVYSTNGGLLKIGRSGPVVLPSSVPTPEPFLGWVTESSLNVLTAVPDGAVTVGSTALATATAVVTLGSLPGLWSTVLLDLIRGLFPLVGPLRKRRRPVGRVINALDGRPIARALVQIFDVTTNRLRETIVAGADGSFGTLLPPGTYLFSVRKPGYAPIFDGASALLFPGEMVATEQPLTVASEGTVVPLVFFMRRMVPYSFGERLKARLVRWWRTLQLGLARIALPFLLIGAALNVVMLLRRPSALLFGITLLYLVFLVLELLVARRFRRAFGRVVDATVRKPVALALIRLTDPVTKRIIQTRVTTAGGQYLMLAPRGEYQLQFAHPQYQPLQQGVAIRPRIGSAVVFDAALTPRSAV